MSWIGKVVGGTLGAVIAGPAGAVIGAGLGHGLDALSDKEDSESGDSNTAGMKSEASYSTQKSYPPMDAVLHVEDDSLGYQVLVTIRTPIPASSQFMARVVSNTGVYIQGVPPFRDQDGDFMASGIVHENTCRFYVPIGTLIGIACETYNVEVVTVWSPDEKSAYQTVGYSLFKMPIRFTPVWSHVDLLRPLISLCMAVVRVDDTVSPEEARTVKRVFTEEFELPPSELNDLKQAMKAPTTQDLEKEVCSIFFRFPQLNPFFLLELLSMIAHCGDHVDPKKVLVIKSVADILEISSEGWEDFVNRVDLDPRDYHAILNVSQDASPSDIRAAYLELVAQYHPDRVSSLPIEFQDLAHEKMSEINAAYEALKKHHTPAPGR